MNFNLDVPIYSSMIENLDGQMSTNCLKFANRKEVILYYDKRFNSSAIDYYYHSWDHTYEIPNLKLHKNSKVIIDRSFEDGIPNNQRTKDMLSYFHSFNIPNDNILLISNKAKERMDKEYDYPHIFIDHCAVDVVYRVERNLHDPNTILPSLRPKKIAFMASKIVDKTERLDLIKHMMYGLSPDQFKLVVTFNDDDIKKIRDKEPTAVIKFLNRYKGPLPGSSFYTMSSGGQAPYTWPCDSSFYSESLVSIAGETLPNQPHVLLISEKYYRPVMNLHPIIILMHENYKSLLRERGFNFYESVIGEYENTTESVFQAAKTLMNLSKNQLQQVDIIANNNKQRLISYAYDEAESFGKKINQFLAK